MKNKCIRQICLTAFLYFASHTLYGQINPYQRLTDPLAITYIDSLYPQKFSNGIVPYGFTVQDTGSGVISHIWMTFDWTNPQLESKITISIDDQVVIDESLESFFKGQSGLARAPFDTIMSGGLVCDIQMSYRRNFKISVFPDSPHCCLFWGIAWRPLPLEITPPGFKRDDNGIFALQQSEAEQAYYRKKPEYNGQKFLKNVSEVLKPGETLELLDVVQSGYVGKIALQPATYDQSVLDSLRLQIFWDGSPDAAVDVPVADFFLVTDSIREVESFYIHTSPDSGFVSYFPMPFAIKAHIKLVNLSLKSININSTIEYYSEKIDRGKHGYFFAQFNSTSKAKYKVYHQIAHAKGRGKYVGTIMDIRKKNIYSPSFLEGNPKLNIDSTAKHFIEYPGTEDYFNGGWYFFDSTFTQPFAGCISLWTYMYRFHLLDAIDFEKSLDFEWEHGVTNDYPAPYRTIGIFYKQWKRFWVSQDTVLKGQDWTVAGSGYLPGEKIVGYLGDQILFSTTAEDNGFFKSVIKIPDNFQNYAYQLTVNNEKYDYPVYVLNEPVVYFVKDSLPAALHYTDTLSVIGVGFQPDEKIDLLIDNEYAGSATVDQFHAFKTTITVPHIDTGKYYVKAILSNKDSIFSKNVLTITRTINYEFENIDTIISPLPSYHYSYAYLGFLSYDPWSESGAIQLYPWGRADFTFPFSVAVSDTFQISAFFAKASRYGQYNIFIDERKVHYFDAYIDNTDWRPIRTEEIILDTAFLQEGEHTINFKCIGKNEKSSEHIFLADNMILKPVTAFKKNIVIPQPVMMTPGILYPNPYSTNNNLSVTSTIPKDECGETENCSYTISCFTLLGELAFKTKVVSSFGKINFQLGNLPIGTYFCTFKNEGTGVINTYPLIITD